MTYSREEIEELRKRLEAAERQIGKLAADDLFMSKMLAIDLSATMHNLGIHFQKGQKELESYAKFMGEKLEKTKRDINDAQTVKDALLPLARFDEELTKYLKAAKVKTATEAMDIAHTFIKKYSPVALPLKAIREGNVWLVDIDVGALAVKIAKVKVDAKTGDILSYEIPETGK